MKIFRDRTALVTGGASGIGLALVRQFLELGMNVVAIDCDPEYIAEAQRAGLHPRQLLLQADVSDREQLREVARQTEARFAKLHVLCNNAGAGGGGDVHDGDFAAWDRALAINLGGVVNGVKIFAPMILRHGEGGHIVNTSSMAGIVPLPTPGLGCYQTAKFAIRGLSESLRCSMAPYGIGVSCLFPGGTRTRIVESSVRGDPEREAWARQLTAPWMDPAEVAAAVVRAIRENAAYICTHREFCDEVHELNAMLETAFPLVQNVPPERAEFELQRRATLAQLRAAPIRD